MLSIHEILKALYEVGVADRLMYEKRGYGYVFRVCSCNTYRDGFRTTIESLSEHIPPADEPRDYGGGNAGSNSIELLLKSLVSCFTISLCVYSQKYGFRIDKVEVFAEGSFDIRGFLEMESFEKGLKNTAMYIDVEGGEHCDNVYNVVKEVLNRWIVGSTTKKTSILYIETKIGCLEH